MMTTSKNNAAVLTSLVSVIGSYYNTGNSTEVRFNCVMCVSRGKSSPDTKGHMYYNTKKEVWVCFRCGARGHVSSLIGKDENFDVDIWEALDQAIEDITPESVEDEEETPVKIKYPCSVERVKSNTKAFTYLLSRSMNEDDIRFYRISHGMHQAVSKDGNPIGNPVSRVFVPTYSNRKMTFWVGRRYHSIQFNAPKYVNPTSVDKEHVFNLDGIEGIGIITEGVFSGIAAGRKAMSIFGKEPTSTQIKKMMDANLEEYVVALDGDAMPEALELARYLFYANKSVSFVELPHGDDPDSVDDFDRYLDARHLVDMEFLAKMELKYGIGRTYRRRVS